jgi:hypothetical protein
MRQDQMIRHYISEVMEHLHSHSHYEAIPFLRISSSVNVGLLRELGRAFDLTALKKVFSHSCFLNFKKSKQGWHIEGTFLHTILYTLLQRA